MFVLGSSLSLHRIMMIGLLNMTLMKGRYWIFWLIIASFFIIELLYIFWVWNLLMGFLDDIHDYVSAFIGQNSCLCILYMFIILYILNCQKWTLTKYPKWSSQSKWAHKQWCAATKCISAPSQHFLQIKDT